MLILLTAAILLGEAATPAADKPAVVECPVGQETRIVFPEAVTELRTPPAGVVRSLRLRVIAAAPRAIIALTPTTHPLEASLGFEGPTAKLRVEIRTVATGKSREVRLRADGASDATTIESTPAPPARVSPEAVRVRPKPSPTAMPTPPQTAVRPVGPPAAADEVATPEVVVLRPVWAAPPSPTPATLLLPSPGPSPAPSPSAAIATPATDPMTGPAAASFDASALALAQPQRIGREEGLPGQRGVVLEDALRGKALVWLRFRVPNGAKARLDGVRWERGEIKSVLVEPDGRDLRVVVQLPRAGVTKNTRVELRVDGQAYKFAVSAPWFSSFLRSLF